MRDALVDALLAPSDAVGASIYFGYLAALIALAAASIAFWGVVSQRSIARRKTTLDFILRQESDGDLLRARDMAVRLSKEAGGLAAYARPEKLATSECAAIRIVLNEYELLSIGIQRGVIDFETYCRWGKSGVITTWRHATPFVFSLRAHTKNDALYQEFEAMVGWMTGQRQPRRSRFIGRWF